MENKDLPGFILTDGLSVLQTHLTTAQTSDPLPPGLHGKRFRSSTLHSSLSGPGKQRCPATIHCHGDFLTSFTALSSALVLKCSGALYLVFRTHDQIITTHVKFLSVWGLVARHVEGAIRGLRGLGSQGRLGAMREEESSGCRVPGECKRAGGTSGTRWDPDRAFPSTKALRREATFRGRPGPTAVHERARAPGPLGGETRRGGKVVFPNYVRSAKPSCFTARLRGG